MLRNDHDWMTEYIRRQQETPYFDALLEVAPKLVNRTQAPGHGGHLHWELSAILDAAGTYDVSVVKGVDVASSGATSPLVQAERLLAEATGARSAKLVTTGASGSAAGAITALCWLVGGKEVWVARNAHISVINALVNFGARVRFLPVQVHPLGMATVVDPKVLEQMLKEHAGKVGAVLLSTPCYEGLIGDIEAYVNLCHAYGVPVAVDISWASEMLFSSFYGPSPIALGADLVIASPHKTLGALGQGAWAFLGNDRLITVADFEAFVSRFTSTSKSSLILAALDLIRFWAALNGHRHVLLTARRAEAALKAMPTFLVKSWADEIEQGLTAARTFVPYRATLEVWKAGYTGYEVAEILRKRGVQVALPSLYYIFIGAGILNPWQVTENFGVVAEVLNSLPVRDPLDRSKLPPLELGTAEVDFMDLRGRTPEIVRFDRAIGHRLADPLGAYPPGLAVKVPGEVLDRETAKAIEAIWQAGGTIFGVPPEVLGEGCVRILR